MKGESGVGLSPLCARIAGSNTHTLLYSFVDAARKIVEEEGAPALWRAWWLTAVGNVLSAFS